MKKLLNVLMQKAYHILNLYYLEHCTSEPHANQAMGGDFIKKTSFIYVADESYHHLYTLMVINILYLPPQFWMNYP